MPLPSLRNRCGSIHHPHPGHGLFIMYRNNPFRFPFFGSIVSFLRQGIGRAFSRRKPSSSRRLSVASLVRKRNGRQRMMEQLEARRVFATALYESLELAHPGYSGTQWVGSPSSLSETFSPFHQSEMLGEGEGKGNSGNSGGSGQGNGGNGQGSGGSGHNGGGPALGQLVSEVYYSPQTPGYVRDSNYRKQYVDDSDIVKLSIYSSGAWRHDVYFDGGDVGLSTGSENIDAFAILPNGKLLLSTVGRVNVSGVAADGEDILLFDPTELGSRTAGSWQLYVDGSDLGLSSWEGLDGVSVLSDGRLVISTDRDGQVPNASFEPEDLLVLKLSQTGAQSIGTWQRYFDGSDVGLSSSNENVDGVAVEADGKTIHLSTRGDFRVPDLRGEGRDVFTFEATQLGSNTQGKYRDELTINGSRLGLLCNAIDAIEYRSYGSGNLPPTIVPLDPQAIPELSQWQLALTASDADTPLEQLGWSLVSGPDGLSLSPNGLMAWTPTEVQGPGSFQAIVAVSDGARSAQATISITVQEVNQAPVLQAIPNRTALLHENFQVVALASDSDLPANQLTYSLTSAPIGATIHPTNGLIAWTTNQIGPANFVVRVSDEGGLTASQSFTVSVAGWDLRELDRFRSEIAQTLTVPAANSSLQIALRAPTFDTSSTNDIRDAFEIELTDLNGNRIVLPYDSRTDASFNWTEGLSHTGSAGVVFVDGGNGNSTVTINLSALEAGTPFRLRMRLVNNDSDNGTAIQIHDVRFVSATGPAPTGASLSQQSVATGEVDFRQWQDVTGSLQVEYGRSTLAGEDDRLLTEVQLRNRGNEPLRGPLLLVLQNVSDIDVRSLRPDGLTPEGQPYYQIPIGGQRLASQQASPSRAIGFLNPSGERFDYQFQILAPRNDAPSGFTTTPISSIEAGDLFSYTANANDPNGDELTYSILSGPSSATVDPGTGRLSWNTAANDVGSHRFTIRATDSFGAFVEQTFTLEVLASLQNRPPNFVSDPVTDAIASSGFEVITVATGAGPAGVGVISGFRGPRLVSINAGDQSVSVHAGQKNDRFDDTTVYSTGEPKPTGAVIDVGYTIDVGLPPFLVPADRNEVLGMDQGDLNGDGILDLVVMTARFESTRPAGQRNKIEITRSLGDGDGNFSTPNVIASIPTTTFTNSFDQAKNLRIADIDSDGRWMWLRSKIRRRDWSPFEGWATELRARRVHNACNTSERLPIGGLGSRWQLGHRWPYYIVCGFGLDAWCRQWHLCSFCATSSRGR